MLFAFTSLRPCGFAYEAKQEKIVVGFEWLAALPRRHSRQSFALPGEEEQVEGLRPEAAAKRGGLRKRSLARPGEEKTVVGQKAYPDRMRPVISRHMVASKKTLVGMQKRACSKQQVGHSSDAFSANSAPLQ
ncbi:MAG TPA: hypothetical protein VG797_10575 [Phycisphaerales bacterium]|nr:hypothetical protein [Phycisphaerales bacterium]